MTIGLGGRILQNFVKPDQIIAKMSFTKLFYFILMQNIVFLHDFAKFSEISMKILPNVFHKNFHSICELSI